MKALRAKSLKSTEVKETLTHGPGIFACISFKKGDVIVSGFSLGVDGAFRDSWTPSKYLRRCIDDPNVVELSEYSYLGLSDLVALRPIAIGEELCIGNPTHRVARE